MTYFNVLLEPLLEIQFIPNRIVGARGPSPLRGHKWACVLERFQEAFFIIYTDSPLKRGKV
jgi:hypothetical protein